MIVPSGNKKKTIQDFAASVAYTFLIE